MGETGSVLSVSKREAWINAFRPKTLTASFAPVPAATALASADGGVIGWIIPLSAILSAICIQTGMNLINDALDFKKGADTKDRMGHIRLVQSGILSSNQVLAMGLSFFLLALLCGVPLILQGGIPLLCILLISCLCGYCYTGGPFPLAYTGMSDVFVVAFYGIVLTGSVYYLQTGNLTLNALVAGFQIGLLATVMLAINNLRDVKGDAKANKRTLAVRFGQTFSKIEITLLATLPFAFSLYWLMQNRLSVAFLPFLALPVAIVMLRGLWNNEPSPLYNRFLAQGAMLHLSFSLLLVLAFAFEFLA